jgi:peptidoglycan/xylan/chitin deacetylase (PgdA/CDA1 family)
MSDRSPGAGQGAGELLVLCYHAVSESWPSPAAITPRALRAQVRFLLRRSYRPMTLSAALADGAPRRAVALTFDDAYASILTKGLPVLAELGVPATVFVPTDAAGDSAPMTWSELAQWAGGEHESELRCMSWEQLRELSRRGWEIGSHTCSHPRLTEIAAERARGELSSSRAACEEEIQRPCPSLAYPFGDYDEPVMRLAAAAGYEAAVTLDERLASPLRGRGPLEVPREAIYRSTSLPLFAAKTSRLLRRVRISRPYASIA